MHAVGGHGKIRGAQGVFRVSMRTYERQCGGLQEGEVQTEDGYASIGHVLGVVPSGILTAPVWHTRGRHVEVHDGQDLHHVHILRTIGGHMSVRSE